MQDSSSLRTDLRLFTWSDVSAYRKHVALSCSNGGPLCSMVPRAKFFQHLVHKVLKVEREEAYISF